MHAVAVLVACLACVSHARRVHTNSNKDDQDSHNLRTIARLLTAKNPAAAFVPSGATGSLSRPLASRTLPCYMMARKPIVGGNWKCNPAKPGDLDGLVANINACDTSQCEVYVCPSTIHAGMVYDKFNDDIMVAPQNCNFGGCGAYTGEMSVDQMKEMGFKAVMIGHSERRGEFGLPTPAESNALLATKLKYILDAGLTAIFAIGEPLSVREKGIAAVVDYCKEQLVDILPILKDLEDKSRVVIAYEPVWSIGTGVTASPEQAQETHAALRAYLKEAVDAKTAEEIRIQYGGSANAENAPDLSACADIDGFLVGGASLKPEFKDIVAAIAKAKGAGASAPSASKAAPASTAASAPATVPRTGEMSLALPFAPRPAHLDGTYAGDVGFDPLNIGGMYNLKWMREAELKHARVCMLAFLGYCVTDAGIYAPGAPQVSSLKAHDVTVASGHMLFLLFVVGVFEALSYPAIQQMLSGETDRAPGDYGFDPFGFKKSKSYQDGTYSLAEIKNGRLAMLAFSGIVTASALYEKPFPYF